MSQSHSNGQKKQPQESVYEVVDVESLSIEHAEQSLKRITKSRPDLTVTCDLLIVGGGTGGVAAALRALQPRHGSQPLKICLTEETAWLGGQMTAQGVSALDENYLVETSGAARSYQNLRTAIRSFYRESRKLSEKALAEKYLNPGNCWVTRLAFEPEVALDQLQALFKEPIDNGRLALYPRHKTVYVAADQNQNGTGGDSAAQDEPEPVQVTRIGSVNLDTGELIEFHPRLVVDATELGDLLPLAGVPYRSGAEPHSLTGEKHAPAEADVDNVQDFVFPFVLEFRPGESHRIEKPARYDEFAARGKFSLDGYKMFLPAAVNYGDQAATERQVEPFWTYRRLIDCSYFDDERYPADLSMINWDSNDLRGHNIIDKTPAEQAQRLLMGKELSLSFLYWLQNEAPRDDGSGKGYPELMLRRDVLGSKDGLSKFPYIRESRRIVAHKQITEEEIASATNHGARAKLFDDTVGIGLYPIDIHGKQNVPGAGQETKPFQIPLSSLIPRTQINLLPACKNIGVTHVTNGAYRLHPIEWAIGEAQGAVSQMILARKIAAADLLGSKKILRELQNELIQAGAPLTWFDDVPTNHPDFAAIQFLTVSGIIAQSQEHLHFRPDDSITRAEAALALHKVMAPRRIYPAEIKDVEPNTDLYTAVEACLAHDLFSLTEAKEFRPDLVLTKTEFDQMSTKLKIAPDKNPHEVNDPLLRTEFASAIYPLAISRAPVVRR